MEKLGPKSIESWAADAEKLFKRASKLSPTQMANFVECQVGEDSMENSANLKKKLEEGTFNEETGWAGVFYKRVNDYHTYTISIAAAIYIGSAIDRPAYATMYANYLQYQAFKFKKKHVDMDFVSIVFSNGFPNEQTLKKLWEAQKINSDTPGCVGDNLLDQPQFGLSIAFK